MDWDMESLHECLGLESVMDGGNFWRVLVKDEAEFWRRLGDI
jgi:hypothetical protein